MYRLANNSVVDLLHPDLLSSSVLEALLREQKIGEEHISNASREQLLNLYSKLILPLPQREPRKNRRGSYLLKKNGANSLQEKPTPSDVKVKSSSVPCPEPQSRLKPPPATTNKTIGLHATEPLSRLKPPPVSMESGKVIKLNSKTTNGDTVISSKRSVSPSVDSKRPKLIRLNLSSPPQNNKSKDGHSQETVIKEPVPPKKKHKPILWP